MEYTELCRVTSVVPKESVWVKRKLIAQDQLENKSLTVWHKHSNKHVVRGASCQQFIETHLPANLLLIF